MKDEKKHTGEPVYEFQTKDSEEATFLMTQDDKFRLLSAKPVEMYGKVSVWFKFESKMPPVSIEALRTDYRHRKCLVEPRKYSDMRAEIRNLVRECRESGTEKQVG